MIKKVEVDKLKIGVYIHDFNSTWMKHPFFRGRLLIRNQKMLDKVLMSGISELYIDSTKGRDIIDLPSKEEIKKLFESEYDFVVEHTPIYQKPATLREEIQRAKQVKSEAKTVVQKVAEDIQNGNKIEVEPVDSVVEKIVDSITRNRSALLTLLNIKERDEYTFMHSIRASVLVVAFCRYLDLEHDLIKSIGIGALLHDIGKLKIPEDILNKPGKLTLEEYEVMKKHTEYGRDILSELDDMPEEAIRIAWEHHEQFDGLGYPRGLTGEQISLGAQMVALVNVYDTIISETIYSEAREPVKALKIIYDLMGGFFEEDLAQKFIKAVGVYPVGTLVMLTSGMIAVVVEANADNPLHPKVRIIYDAKRNINLAPRDLDLSGDSEYLNQIKCAVSPVRWKLNPFDYLDIPKF